MLSVAHKSGGENVVDDVKLPLAKDLVSDTTDSRLVIFD
jgi:hypothetical protein